MNNEYETIQELHSSSDILFEMQMRHKNAAIDAMRSWMEMDHFADSIASFFPFMKKDTAFNQLAKHASHPNLVGEGIYHLARFTRGRGIHHRFIDAVLGEMNTHQIKAEAESKPNITEEVFYSPLIYGHVYPITVRAFDISMNYRGDELRGVVVHRLRPAIVSVMHSRINDALTWRVYHRNAILWNRDVRGELEEFGVPTLATTGDLRGL